MGSGSVVIELTPLRSVDLHGLRPAWSTRAAVYASHCNGWLPGRRLAPGCHPARWGALVRGGRRDCALRIDGAIWATVVRRRRRFGVVDLVWQHERSSCLCGARRRTTSGRSTTRQRSGRAGVAGQEATRRGAREVAEDPITSGCAWGCARTSPSTRCVHACSSSCDSCAGRGVLHHGSGALARRRRPLRVTGVEQPNLFP